MNGGEVLQVLRLQQTCCQSTNSVRHWDSLDAVSAPASCSSLNCIQSDKVNLLFFQEPPLRIFSTASSIFMIRLICPILLSAIPARLTCSVCWAWGEATALQLIQVAFNENCSCPNRMTDFEATGLDGSQELRPSRLRRIIRCRSPYKHPSRSQRS